MTQMHKINLRHVPKHLRTKEALKRSTDEELDIVAALCNKEPAEPESCLACYAYCCQVNRADSRSCDHHSGGGIALRPAGTIDGIRSLESNICLLMSAAERLHSEADFHPDGLGGFHRRGLTDGEKEALDRLRSWIGPEKQNESSEGRP